jgi:hypothetical protein
MPTAHQDSLITRLMASPYTPYLISSIFTALTAWSIISFIQYKDTARCQALKVENEALKKIVARLKKQVQDLEGEVSTRENAQTCLEELLMDVGEQTVRSEGDQTMQISPPEENADSSETQDCIEDMEEENEVDPPDEYEWVTEEQAGNVIRERRRGLLRMQGMRRM